MTKLTPAELETGLAQFYGTEHYYRHMGPIVLTDGAKYLADNAGCYWLYDIVFSVLPKLRGEGFAAVKLTVDLAKKKGIVVIDDGNGRKLYRQVIPYTDFPLAASRRRCSCCRASIKKKRHSRKTAQKAPKNPFIFHCLQRIKNRFIGRLSALYKVPPKTNLTGD